MTRCGVCATMSPSPSVPQKSSSHSLFMYCCRTAGRIVSRSGLGYSSGLSCLWILWWCLSWCLMDLLWMTSLTYGILSLYVKYGVIHTRERPLRPVGFLISTFISRLYLIYWNIPRVSSKCFTAVFYSNDLITIEILEFLPIIQLISLMLTSLPTFFFICSF